MPPKTRIPSKGAQTKRSGEAGFMVGVARGIGFPLGLSLGPYAKIILAATGT